MNALSPENRKFPLIQALRALAALSVALSHTTYDALHLSPGAALDALYNFMPWDAGVDIFFVISGFVIVHSARPLFARPGAARQFLARRVSRIVPLYWLMTSLFILNLLLLPGEIRGVIGGPGYILRSYLFIPAARPGGLVQPPLGLGWTLNYEMFFYAVLTPFLVLERRRAVCAATLCLTAFVSFGFFVGFPGIILHTWSNPIVLEFCAGMLLSLAAPRLILPRVSCLALAIAALFLLHLHLQEDQARILFWGVPALMLVLAAISWPATAHLPALEALGDASYALYLSHPFVMRAMEMLWHRTRLAGHGLLYVLLSLALAQILALALHRAFERPASSRLRDILETGRLRSQAT